MNEKGREDVVTSLLATIPFRTQTKKKKTELVTHQFPLSDVINVMRIHVLLMSYSILALRPPPPTPDPLCVAFSPPTQPI